MLGNPPHHLETQPHTLQYDVLIGGSSKSLPSDSPPLDFFHVFTPSNLKLLSNTHPLSPLPNLVYGVTYCFMFSQLATEPKLFPTSLGGWDPSL